MGNKIVTAWSNAISIAEHRPERYAKNITLRYIITAPFDADSMWLTFDNFCGTEAIKIAKAFVAKSNGDMDIETGAMAQVLFNGNSTLKLGTKETSKSDELTFSVKKGDKLAVSFYLDDYTSMDSGVFVSGPLSKSFFAIGDFTDKCLDMELTKENSMVYFLSQIDFSTDEKNHSLVCFGDSITAQNWPDELALLAYANPDNHTAIVRRAASGCRVLRQYSCIKYDSYGLKADIRVPHELPLPGADEIIIQEGINDIIHPVGIEENPFRPWEDLPTFEELRDGILYIVDEAHKLGMKAYLGTLLPIGGWRTYAEFRDELRVRINEWIRTCSEADGCVDFDMALRDASDYTKMVKAYDSGDHLHPSALGYKTMAAAVPQKLYRN